MISIPGNPVEFAAWLRRVSAYLRHYGSTISLCHRYQEAMEIFERDQPSIYYAIYLMAIDIRS